MNPKIFRKRFIPDEIVDISGDEILFNDRNIIVTRWKPIHERNDFAGGISFAFLSEGYKIGYFYKENNEFLYWYIDIIEVEYNEKSNSYTFIDLLTDVKVLPDGSCDVLDLDELEQSLEKGYIDNRQYELSQKNLKKVTEMIETKTFPPKFVSDFLKNLYNV
ncbi:MAG: DUF402 domain-containing protein [Ignavibacteriales bacterium]